MTLFVEHAGGCRFVIDPHGLVDNKRYASQ
jgi:hypothetical protein